MASRDLSRLTAIVRLLDQVRFRPSIGEPEPLAGLRPEQLFVTAARVGRDRDGGTVAEPTNQLARRTIKDRLLKRRLHDTERRVLGGGRSAELLRAQQYRHPAPGRRAAANRQSQTVIGHKRRIRAAFDRAQVEFEKVQNIEDVYDAATACVLRAAA